MLNKRLFKQIDISLPVLALILVGIGLLMIASATNLWESDFLQRQITSAILGFLLLITVTFFDYRVIKDYAYLLYGATILLLSINLILSPHGIAAQRSLVIGPVNFQPSELAKLGLIFLLASILSREENIMSPHVLAKLLAATTLAFVLILRSDLGTAIILWFILIVVLFVAGFPLLYLFVFGGVSAGLLATWIFAHLHWGVWIPLRGYQLMRLLVFWNPGMDPYGYGYHLIQSKIAIGSGLFAGKGLFGSTQTRLDFLPEQHTDFIFSVLGEELGFLGGAILLILYFLLIYKGLQVVMSAKDRFGAYLAAGITGMFSFHIIVNIGMTIGMLPITGIPLPFMSYGGSSLVTNLVAVGILVNIHMRRQKILY